MLASLSDEEAGLLLYDWQGLWARPDQVAPPGDWIGWLLLAGRGYGKTRAGAEKVREWARSHRYVNLIGQTPADVRDVMIEGESGILACCPPDERPQYRPSKRRLEWPSGCISLIFSGEDPDGLRGPQHEKLWCVARGELVETEHGSVPIEDVLTGDRIWTRSGLHRVSWSGRTGRRETLRIVTSNGSVRCTPDHRVWLNGAWERADAAAPGDTMAAWSYSPLGLPHGLSGMAHAGTETVETATTETRPASSSTSRSGLASTAPSLKVRTSTTSTATRRTTLQRISTRSPLETTRSSTLLRSESRARLGEAPLSHCGIDDSLSRGSASSAKRRTRLAPPTPVSAIRTAAHDTVVLSVEQCSACDVYDLAVAGAHEFFAGGLLVHNCDEPAAWQYPQETWDMAMFGLRLGEHPQWVATSTPKPIALIRSLVESPDVVITKGTTYDNLHNLGPAYRSIIARYEGTRLGRQELLAELLLDEGLAYRFSERLHVVAPFAIPDAWDRFEHMDYGTSAPNAWYVTASDHDGNLVVFDGFYEPGLPSTTAPRIKQLRATGWEAVRDGKRERNLVYADPAVFARGSLTKWGREVARSDEFLEAGIPLLSANNDRPTGFVRISELLRADDSRRFPDWHPRAGEPGSPSLFIMDVPGTLELREQLQDAPLEEEGKPHPGEAIDRDWERSHGHAHASLRYGVLSRPAPSKSPKPEITDPRAARIARIRERRTVEQKSDLVNV